MRVFRHLALLICLVAPFQCFGQSEEWLPITDQDRQFKDVPGFPGAAAVRLYYAHYIDDNASMEFVYERIKILNEKALNPNEEGKTYADVEIPVATVAGVLVTLSDLKARTIHPDGSIVEFNGKIFEKTVYKGRGNKVAVKAFSMPDVSVGSIVEYKFKRFFQAPLYLPIKVFPPGEWVLQSELYTVKEYARYTPFGGGVFQSTARPMFYFDGAQIARVTFNLKEKPKNKGNESELELHNVAPFESEDYMPPEDNYKPSVIFFYSRKGAGNTEQEWQDIAKDRTQLVEQFMNKNRGVKEAALQAIGGEGDAGKKLHKLYERAQQVRNLTFERERTEEERKKENILRNDGVGDVLAHGYGDSEDITLLFVALARAAGFDAAIVQASDRKKRFFAKDWTSLRQLDGMIAVVNVNGADIFLEPGTRFCPFGYLSWNHTATDALKLDKKGGVFLKAPPVTFDKSVTRRTVNASLEPNGTLKGSVIVEFHGEEALEHRLDAIDRDEAGRKKMLEDEVKEWAPTGAIVKITEAKGWESAEDPLEATFSLEVPSYASTAGKLFVVPACLFQTKQNRAFTHATRKYPVYFPYPFTEADYVSITVPPGFSVESVPPQQDASLKYARYQNLTQFTGTQLVTQRRLAFNGIYFDLDKYQELKDFFGKVKTGDEQQAVLHGGNVSAQKNN